MSDSNGNVVSTTEAAVFRAIDRVNELLAEPQRMTKRRSLLLTEDGTAFDSLTLINLLVFIEDEVRDTFGQEVNLTADDGTGPLNDHDLKTLGSLIDALHNLLSATAR
jgi:acyl carrier protein